jgi:hypothetical protein
MHGTALIANEMKNDRTVKIGARGQVDVIIVIFGDIF